MALLVQAESIVMFWGRYDVLWGFVAALIVVDLILVRMGVQSFDREELLGREFDTLNPRQAWRTFKRFFTQVGPYAASPPFSLMRVYRRDLPAIMRRAGNASKTVFVATAIGLIGGWVFAQLQPADLTLNLNASALTTPFILGNNLRVVALSMLVGIFTFGVIPTVVPLVNSALIAFVVTRAADAGLNPFAILAAGILPHGIFEVTAVWLASIVSLRLGAAVIARPPRMTVGEGWLLALADCLKVLVFVVAPLLTAAAFIEVHVTPALLRAVLGR